MKTLNYNELLSILSYNLDQNTLKKRYFIALAGPPASGKSTISEKLNEDLNIKGCLLYTSPSPRDGLLSRMPSSA